MKAIAITNLMKASADAVSTFRYEWMEIWWSQLSYSIEVEFEHISKLKELKEFLPGGAAGDGVPPGADGLALSDQVGQAGLVQEVSDTGEVAEVSKREGVASEVGAAGEPLLIDVQHLLEFVLAGIDGGEVAVLPCPGEHHQMQHQVVDQVVEVVGLHLQPLIHHSSFLQAPSQKLVPSVVVLCRIVPHDRPWFCGH